MTIILYVLLYVIFIIISLLLFAFISLFLATDYGLEDLGQDFQYFEEVSFIDYDKQGDTLSLYIPPKVVSFNNSKDFILAKQRPEEFDDAWFFPKRFDYYVGRDTVYFWLIDKRSKELTGPLLESDMEKVLKEKNLEKMMKKLKN